MIKRLLIANRGEIALRIIRACREAGVSSVAVYSEADRDAPHLALADTAVCIGPGPASESYLNVPRLLEAARQTGADAIHPGYGFLSENAAFAQACTDAGLTFIGPPADVIHQLGDKIAAKQRMAAAGVPVVPGYADPEQSDTTLQTEADKIGVPLLVKAAAGGGGRGMRRIDDLTDFLPQLSEARQEAQSAFGDSRMLLERYVLNPHHIEFQIFGDSHGNAVHLYERECSVQRRHQKVIEESPSPALTPELRARMAEAAVTVARTAGYVGAGTVEFLLEPQPNGEPCFYFLEVNTRLQVEHPVTEMITGLDLVRWQFQVANGQPLPLAQTDIPAQRGHAIEVRIYAEDPSTGFLPSIGTITRWEEPSGPGVRVDAGYQKSMTVSPFYDAMLAKLIVYGTDRPQAIARLLNALREFVILGVKTNIPYLIAIVSHPEFQAGHTTTGFLAEHLADWKPQREPPLEVLLALAADAALPRSDRVEPEEKRRRGSPWLDTDHWRNSKP